MEVIDVGNKQEVKEEYWETVNRVEGVYRRSVPGGWLIKAQQVFHIIHNQQDPKLIGVKKQIPVQVNLAIGLTFYPDAEHAWKI